MFRAKDKCIYLQIFILIVFFIHTSFILGTQYLSYYKAYKINKFEEINPDMMITTLEEFYFKKNFKIEYYTSNISNLGKTGDLYFKCYTGICKLTIKKLCEREVCYESSGDYDVYPSINIFNFKKNNSKNLRKLSSCHIKTYDCSTTENVYVLECSKECSTKDGYYSNTCSSCPFKYDSLTGNCNSGKGYNEYSPGKFCSVENLILYWKELYYENRNKNYTYVFNIVAQNETCPSGKKQCGILDNFGNKLCIPNSEICPINFIKISNEPPDTIHSFTAIEIGNQTLYYSNEFENGKIVKGIYADSDVQIQYNEGCEILDTYNLSNFILENKIYKNYKIDDEILKTGKSYLKWCSTFNKDYSNNLSIIKNEYEQYLFNSSVNKDIIEQTKTRLSSEFFCTFFSSIYSLVFIFFTIWSICYERCNDKSLFNFWCFSSEEEYFKNDLLDFLKFIIILIPFLVLSILNTIWSSKIINDLTKANKYQTEQSDLFESIIFLNKLFFWGNIDIFCLILLLFILSLIVHFVQNSYTSNDINYNKKKLISNQEEKNNIDIETNKFKDDNFNEED